MDIVEMDAASHRSIRDVEEIRDNVKFPPMELRYKVFIIDEAHQLSNDAKDAFLKTLEEPPAHTVFVLATTEPQSIPITIRSRCQQFDFRRGSLKDIRDRLKFVLDSEGVEADEDATDLIALNAEGSWRDSLSLLEQVLAYTDNRVTAADVNAVLGTVTQDFLYRLADVIAEGDEQGAFEAAADAMESGKEIQQLLKSLSQHFRNLLFAQVSKDLSGLAVSEEAAARMREQAAKFDRGGLLRAMEVFSQAEHDIRYSDQHGLLLELALLKTINALRPVKQEAQPAPSLAPKAEAPRRSRTNENAAPSKAAPAMDETMVSAEELPPPAPAEQKLPEFDRIKDKWNLVLQHVKKKDKSAHALLLEAVPVDVRGESIVLRFKYQFHADGIGKAGSNPKRQALMDTLQMVFGVADIGIACEVEQSPKEPSVQAEIPPEAADSGQETLNRVLDIFHSAEIVDS
jgi:DNA polymerase III subunit gamma/tau